jgi:hypothetical protein
LLNTTQVCHDLCTPLLLRKLQLMLTVLGHPSLLIGSRLRLRDALQLHLLRPHLCLPHRLLVI